MKVFYFTYVPYKSIQEAVQRAGQASGGFARQLNCISMRGDGTVMYTVARCETALGAEHPPVLI